ncbi:MAG: putative rRNA maturation factor [Cyclobacteriaceae bacterium]|jgi:probable rRNA maturation factor
MIDFSYQTEFELTSEIDILNWIGDIIITEGYVEGDISYVFCDDNFLLDINKEFLDHDTLTDIISFDYSLGKQIHGEIYISVERVAENAISFDSKFLDELHRVIIHGVLHYCGYKDKNEKEAKLMRIKEDECLKRRNFM